jgi:hypothetical protein
MSSKGHDKAFHLEERLERKFERYFELPTEADTENAARGVGTGDALVIASSRTQQCG